MDLSGLGEFGLIELIRERFASIPSHGCEGIGDDCAVLPLNTTESMVVTTDLLVEDIHFLRDRITPEQLGRKSLAVNLSDVAAMGAAPVASFLSLSLPPGVTGVWIDAFLAGYHALSTQFGVPLLGGDTTSARDRLTVSVTAIGRAENTHLKRRGDAKPGDRIFVTGYLGDSAQGLQDMLSGRDTPFIALHNKPEPFVNEGIWLGGRNEVHAMMDISDGIASDLLHILQMSGVGAEVSLDMIPTNTPIELAVAGGEDYKLLLTADVGAAARLAEDYKAKFGEPLYEIGRIVAGEEIRWLDRGNPVLLEYEGFAHF
ncbi:MAG: thiamine-phosphate kinase [Alistipes indistinctus]|uniref:thiamine-phosphate kinase n=1 Tax=Alistipes indistinctus TaxID=626932 RepID=UPI00241CC744|nr:thiamine-phosphate kinase [Alistipes indistinctus]MBD9133565.1 thiamine-phosphate kinase [Alistipes indistinctus]